MLKSMTGFGRAKYQIDGREYIVEIKSVNYKYSDVSVRLPRNISYLEEFIKKDYINREFVRNNINVLLPSNDLDEVSYNLLIKNMNLLLNKGINIKGLDSDGMNFYVSSTKLIEDNLSTIEESKLNIKTRIYKDNNNFTFLGRNSNGHYIRYRSVKRKLKNKYYYYQKGYISLNEFVSSLSCYSDLLKKEPKLLFKPHN